MLAARLRKKWQTMPAFSRNVMRHAPKSQFLAPAPCISRLFGAKSSRGGADIPASDCVMDKFVARENVRHLRRELENGVEPNTRTTMLRLLVEEENLLGHSYEQLARLDRHISRLAEIMARQVQIGDELRANGRPTEQAELILATYNDLMACYMAHRDRINASLSV